VPQVLIDNWVFRKGDDPIASTRKRYRERYLPRFAFKLLIPADLVAAILVMIGTVVLRPGSDGAIFAVLCVTLMALLLSTYALWLYLEIRLGDNAFDKVDNKHSFPGHYETLCHALGHDVMRTGTSVEALKDAGRDALVPIAARILEMQEWPKQKRGADWRIEHNRLLAVQEKVYNLLDAYGILMWKGYAKYYSAARKVRLRAA
ncbi:MAG: hypothetical protein WC050_00175, partial [Candidatus Paceibacterota bacterium]